MIQYASRFLKWYTEGNNEAMNLAFKGMFGKLVASYFCRKHGGRTQTFQTLQIL